MARGAVTNDRTIRVRVTSETFAALEQQAGEAGLSLAAYLRPLLDRRAAGGLAPMFRKKVQDTTT